MNVVMLDTKGPNQTPTTSNPPAPQGPGRNRVVERLRLQQRPVPAGQSRPGRCSRSAAGEDEADRTGEDRQTEKDNRPCNAMEWNLPHNASGLRRLCPLAHVSVQHRTRGGGENIEKTKLLPPLSPPAENATKTATPRPSVRPSIGFQPGKKKPRTRKRERGTSQYRAPSTAFFSPFPPLPMPDAQKESKNAVFDRSLAHSFTEVTTSPLTSILSTL
ncbi:hypothetical protein GGR56DRAFT_612573 [Xylariaceae sp. FL0804]|nr:hypothetical protein GGR56DRAFT_612573 [Xylariaceae sp. FL0804]